MKTFRATSFALSTLLMLACAAYGQGKCSNTTIKGAYGFNITGSISGAPLVIVGVVTNDDEGSFSSTYTISINGTVTPGAQLVGTYTVNSDCTASFTDTTNDLHYTAVILRHGEEMFSINTDSGNTFSGDFKKQ